MNATTKQIDHDDGEDYFIVTDGCVEIMDKYGDSGIFYASREITEMLAEFAAMAEFAAIEANEPA